MEVGLEWDFHGGILCTVADADEIYGRGKATSDALDGVEDVCAPHGALVAKGVDGDAVVDVGVWMSSSPAPSLQILLMLSMANI